MIERKLLEECVDFHGHLCPGILMGIRSALIARDRLAEGPSSEQEYYAVAESRTCGVDAFQVILGTTIGKGNLVIEEMGKQAVTVGDPSSGRALRIALKPLAKMGREAKMELLKAAPDEELFSIVEVNLDFPVRTRPVGAVECEGCGEPTTETALRFLDGKKLCASCLPGALSSR